MKLIIKTLIFSLCLANGIVFVLAGIGAFGVTSTKDLHRVATQESLSKPSKALHLKMAKKQQCALLEGN